MLRLTIGDEYYNEATETFEIIGDTVIELEHCLVSMSKWESKYQKPFLANVSKTVEETEYYIRAMIISPNPPDDIVYKLSKENVKEINDYIESAESATTFGDMPDRKGKGETITSELIYYWMVTFTIPFETERWHLNRLFALIRICNLKNSKPRKMSRGEIARRNAQENEKRKSMLNTTG